MTVRIVTALYEYWITAKIVDMGAVFTHSRVMFTSHSPSRSEGGFSYSVGGCMYAALAAASVVNRAQISGEGVNSCDWPGMFGRHHLSTLADHIRT